MTGPMFLTGIGTKAETRNMTRPGLGPRPGPERTGQGLVLRRKNIKISLIIFF